MAKRALVLIGFILLCTQSGSLLYGWGFWSHQRISRAAIFSLPDSVKTFFYNHIDYITEESVMPDVRIYAINYRQEANRHYVNTELLRLPPGEPMPATLSDAIKKFGDSNVQKAGLLPWYIDDLVTKLTQAFKEKNKPYILFHAADLAHYIGDAHVPLHTSLNHDGQLSGQKGIHAFWESQLPETFGSRYNFFTGNASYIPDTKKEIWHIIEHSQQLVDTLLKADKLLTAQFPPGDVYEKDAAGNVIKNRYNQTKHSYAYASKYNAMLNGMVERQLRASISEVANFWYTAWVNAGSPDLSQLDPPSLTKRNRKAFKNESVLWKKGRLFGLKTANEF